MAIAPDSHIGVGQRPPHVRAVVEWGQGRVGLLSAAEGDVGHVVGDDDDLLGALVYDIVDVLDEAFAEEPVSNGDLFCGDDAVAVVYSVVVAEVVWSGAPARCGNVGPEGGPNEPHWPYHDTAVAEQKDVGQGPTSIGDLVHKLEHAVLAIGGLAVELVVAGDVQGEVEWLSDAPDDLCVVGGCCGVNIAGHDEYGGVPEWHHLFRREGPPVHLKVRIGYELEGQFRFGH